MDETLEIFFAETDDLLRSAEESLLRLERNPKPGPDAEELFRSLHTLKSGSAMVGFAVMSRCAHLLENLLENVRSGKLPITKPLISFLLENLDFVRAMFDRCAAGQPEADAEEVKAFKAKISRFAAEEVPSKPRLRISPTAVSQPEADPATAAKVNLGKIEHYYEIVLKFQKNMFEVGNDPLIVLRNLADLGEAVEITPDLSRMPRYEELAPDQLYIGWRVVLKTAALMEYIEDVFMFVRDDNDIVITDISNRYREGIDVQEADAPLGEVLVEKAGVSREDVRYALEKQKKIGEILVDEGKLDKAILDQVISRQQQSREMYRKNSVRVDVQKIDRLMDLAEEIAVGLSRMQNILSKRRDYFASEIEHEMEILLKINHEFQERVTNARMFSLEGTFHRYQRLVRDTALAQNKQVKVSLAGIDTELDKEIIEFIADPLKHLVRNCVDHGIELPEEREASGKPSEGLISFSAYQKGSRIYIQISDDGRGLNQEKISRQALSMGLLKEGEPIENDTLIECICQPGFSTAENITELSGRGVGMDVVRTQVERVGGSISVESVEGRGTAFTLSFPLSYALMHALHVSNRAESYLVPLWGVVATENFDAEKMRTFGASEKLYRFREDYLPSADLEALFSGAKSERSRPPVMVFINTGRQKFGLLVDQVLAPCHVVVKSIEKNFQGIKGLAGATIMGDGSVALVLDLLGIEEIFFKNASIRRDQ